MRNYMFDRQEPGAAVIYEKPHRRFPVAKAAGVLMILMLIAMTITFVIFFNQIRNLRAQLSGNNSYGGGDSSFGVQPTDAPQVEKQETTIPRAAAGVGALMTVTEERGAALPGTEIYQKVLPSIVSVTAYGRNSGSSGSGVVLNADGYVITNYHVISGSERAWVTPLTTGLRSEAKLVGYDEQLDIAVLKIDADGLVPAQFGSSRMLEVGETVYAIGNPMGYLYGTMTSGIVSAADRTINLQGNSMALIQIDAALNSGNSGGALVNVWGQVVGITVAKIDPHGEVTTEGLGLAIPVSEARRHVNTILRKGEMENPAIGITCVNWQEGTGVEVRTVNEDSPARAAGLMEYDVIVAANGIEIATVDELKDILYDLGVGAELRCSVLRNGEALEIAFDLYEM